MSQEFCLECGLRLPGASRLGPAPASPRQVMLPLLVAAVVAIAGAAAAIALTRDTATATTILTATGGSETVPASTVRADSALAEWPTGTTGWTNSSSRFRRWTAATLPSRAQSRLAGRDCDASACSIRRATRASTPDTGSSSPGVYPSEPEATSRLREARGVQRGAHTQRVSR